MGHLLHPTQDNFILHELHFIVPNLINVTGEVIKKALKKFGCKSAILSNIHMYKENCITKEKYEEMYKTNEESEKRMDLSVGEDLETFIERIKNGEINKDTIPEHGEKKSMFLLCLLDKEERRKLEQKQYHFMGTFFAPSVKNYYIGREVDVPEEEFKASESNMKFAKSKCTRWTCFIDASSISSDSDSDNLIHINHMTGKAIRNIKVLDRKAVYLPLAIS